MAAKLLPPYFYQKSYLIACDKIHYCSYAKVKKNAGKYIVPIDLETVVLQVRIDLETVVLPIGTLMAHSTYRTIPRIKHHQ
jgi:hypothetical protein